MREVRPATNQRAKNRGIEILKFEEVEKMGAAQDNKEVVSLDRNHTLYEPPVKAMQNIILKSLLTHRGYYVSPPVVCCRVASLNYTQNESIKLSLSPLR